MLSSDLLNILACPITKRPLAYAEQHLLSKVLEKESIGELHSISGNKLEGPITGLLINDDKSYCYIIKEGIPILLIDEALDPALFK